MEITVKSNWIDFGDNINDPPNSWDFLAKRGVICE